MPWRNSQDSFSRGKVQWIGSMHKPDWPTFTRIATREPSESGVIRQAAAFNRNLEDRLWGHASMLSTNILGRFTKFGSAAAFGGGDRTSASHSTPLEAEKTGFLLAKH